MDEDIQELKEIIANAPKQSADDESKPAVTASDNDEEISYSKDASMWAMRGGMYMPCEKAIDILPSGQYLVNADPNIGIYFEYHSASFDSLIQVPNSASNEVIQSINTFWNKEEHFRRLNYLWKRGILLWGPPGSGKTCTVQLISQENVKQGGISLYLRVPELTVEGLKVLRKIEPERKLLVIMEDIEAIIRRHGDSEILALLDGEMQIDNVVFIATTNYPELLDKRLVNRPSRFDIVKKVGMPDDRARKAYLQAMHPDFSEDTELLRKWVEETKGFSIAHLKELIISTEVFEVEFEDAVERLRLMAEIDISSEDYDGNSMGLV